jgi:hypothetical protein
MKLGATYGCGGISDDTKSMNACLVARFLRARRKRKSLNERIQDPVQEETDDHACCF